MPFTRLWWIWADVLHTLELVFALALGVGLALLVLIYWMTKDWEAR